MFRSRKNSQKPDEELYSNFKQKFTEVCVPTTGASSQRAASLGDAIMGQSLHHRQAMETDSIKSHEPTPKSLNDQWRLTPSLLDPNSFAFTSFANQPPAYYAATTPGSVAMSYHNQAGDLRTPNTAINMVAPLVIPTAADISPTAHSAIDMGHFQHPFVSHHGHTIDPFAQPHSFSPRTFLHRDLAYDPLDASAEPSPDRSLHVNGSSLGMPAASAAGLSGNSETRAAPGSEDFRFNVTLRAATAMVKHREEIPITYLNKGQAYTVTVVDTAPPESVTPPLKYRTYIRISFEDDEQRSKPAICWQLWKEGRGSSEAHQRDGKLLAVEYVDPSQGGDMETRHPQIQLENALFDGFCVTWTPNPVTGTRDCGISVRFNFLSTDFSHSKGVKGIPVRLCAKTEVLSSGGEDSDIHDQPEVCYCKVKLFRDHGAERKLSNDVAHVKKMIDKLKQQIAQAEIGSGHFDKRKRSCSGGSKGSGNRTIKVPKHKRTWSIESQNGSANRTLEEDLHMKLAGLKDMFSSTRPVSTLNLKGDPQDDPDLFPVYLSTAEPHDDALEPLPPQVVWESSRPSADAGSSASHILSPATSNNSLSSSHRSLDLKHLSFHHPAIYDQSRHDSVDWSSVSQPDSDSQPHSKQGRVLSHPVKVQKTSNRSPNRSDGGWIEAMDVDATYVPPMKFPKRPAACFYVQIQPTKGHKSDGYYHAIYLAQRTAKDLIHAISKKCNFDPARIVRAICIQANGLNVVIDDDVIRELPEGQDMIVEFSELRSNSREPDSDGNPLDHSASPSIMKLIF